MKTDYGTGASSLATVVGDLATRGCRRLLVTSSGPGQGTSFVVSEAGRTLAAMTQESVLLVDADPENPSLRHAFGLHSQRGLTELIDEVYLLDPLKEDPLQFGLGDWFSILRAQRRTGELTVVEGDATWTVRLVKGSIHSVTGPAGTSGPRLGELLAARGGRSEEDLQHALRIHGESGRPIGAVLRALGWVSAEDLREALDGQMRERLTGLVALRMPTCRFNEQVESHRPASGGRPAESSDEVGDTLVFGPMHEYFKRPYLASQIPSYFSDTSIRNLKVLTAGQRETDLQSPRNRDAVAQLLDHLGRIFDLVLVDAPPVTRGGSTIALAHAVDGVLLAVRSNAAEGPAVRQAVAELRRADANVLGIVLNDFSEEDAPPEIPWEALNHGNANPA